jgi:hypothetical protein
VTNGEIVSFSEKCDLFATLSQNCNSIDRVPIWEFSAAHLDRIEPQPYGWPIADRRQSDKQSIHRLACSIQFDEARRAA